MDPRLRGGDELISVSLTFDAGNLGAFEAAAENQTGLDDFGEDQNSTGFFGERFSRQVGYVLDRTENVALEAETADSGKARGKPSGFSAHLMPYQPEKDRDHEHKTCC